MSDKATMLRETDEAIADLRTLLDCLTEEQVRPVWLGVSAVRDSLVQTRQHHAQNRDSRTPQATASCRMARALWAPASFWGLRYPSQRTCLDRSLPPPSHGYSGVSFGCAFKEER
jgi:hypothetical protein